MKLLDRSRLGVAAQALGIAQGALEAATGWSPVPNLDVASLYPPVADARWQSDRSSRSYFDVT
jgi:hypothetical protein